MRNIVLLIVVFINLNLLVNAQSWFNSIQRRVENSIHETERRASEYGKRIHDSYESNKYEVKRKIESFTERNNYNRWRSKISKYTGSISSNLKEIYDDPENLVRYSKKANRIFTRGTIVVIKNIPIYDNEEKRVVSFDSYCRRMLNDLGGDNVMGGDIGNDPVGTAVSLMMDEDYLLKAKIIKTDDGFVSINELPEKGFDDNTIYSIRYKYQELKSNYKRGDKNFGSEFIAFNKNVNSLVKSHNMFLSILKIKNEFLLIQNRYRHWLYHQVGIRNNDITIILAWLSLILIFFFIIKIIWSVIKFPFKLRKSQSKS